MSKNIKIAIRKRNQWFRKAKSSKRQCDHCRYKLLRNSVVNLLRQAKRNHFRNLRSPGTKQFWSAMRYLKKNKSSCQIPTLKKSTSEASTDLEKATMLNAVFSENFNRSIPPLSQTDYQNFRTNSAVCPDHLLCNEDEVLSLILSLDTHTSSGPDGISS